MQTFQNVVIFHTGWQQFVIHANPGIRERPKISPAQLRKIQIFPEICEKATISLGICEKPKNFSRHMRNTQNFSRGFRKSQNLHKSQISPGLLITPVLLIHS